MTLCGVILTMSVVVLLSGIIILTVAVVFLVNVAKPKIILMVVSFSFSQLITYLLIFCQMT